MGSLLARFAATEIETKPLTRAASVHFLMDYSTAGWQSRSVVLDALLVRPKVLRMD
jgi:hypothetical protein